MTFSPKQFRDSLQESNKIGQRFQKYLAECRKSNTEVIFYMMEEFLKILTDKQPLLLKLNALYAINLCVETCEYAAVEMIEAFLLPVLQEGALYNADKRTYAKTSQFFRDKGYPASTPSIDQLSHNYVNLATNLIFTAAAVKPYCYFFTDRLSLPSAFKLLAQKLTQKGNEVPEDILSRAGELQQIYENNLFEFENHQTAYVDFFKKKLSRYLLEGSKGRQALDIRKLLKNNDSWLTSEIIGSLHDALEDENFLVRRHALGLLNELFVWGDVEAIMILNEGEAVEHTYEKFLQVKGTDLGRGAQIYPEIKGQLEQKKNYYVDFLRCLESWAKLVPTAIYLNRDEQSKVSRLYSSLRDKGIVFPSNDLHSRYSKQFEQNMKRSQQRNNYIITQLNEGDTSKNRSVASNRLSKYSQKISLIKEMRQSTILSLSEIQKLVEDAEYTLRNLPKVERQITKNMKTLKYFLQEFEKKFCLLQQSVSESTLENLYERGCKCTEKIAEIDPYYQDYLHGKVDFKKFGELLSARMSQIDQAKSKSKFSDVLSKLSKSKQSLSKDDLSRSLHTTKGKEAFGRHDHVLERSVDEQFSKTQNNLTKTINNPSQLSQKSPNHSKISRLSARQQKQEPDPDPQQLILHGGKHEKSTSRLKEEHKNSISFSRQESVRSNDKEKSPATAQFILDDKSERKKESQISKGSSVHQRKSNPSSNSSKVNPSLYHHNAPTNEQPPKKKQEFSDNSQWSSSEDEAKEQEKPAKPQSIMKPQSTKNKMGESKSREVFSDSSFSQYDESNEEIREAIDKSENPDFKMLFKDKTFDNNPSHHSKLSKLQSQQHYAAVLESLAPKPSQQADKSFSKLSKDKSTSQLPPRSNYDNNSKIDQRNYQVPEADYSAESLKLDPPKPSKAKLSKNSGSKEPKNSNQPPSGQQDSNSMYPPDKQKSSLSKPGQSFQLSPPPSSLKEHEQFPLKNNPSKISSDGSQLQSSLSKVKSEDNFKKKASRISQENIAKPHQKTERVSEVRLQSIKEQKLNEIKELEKRIQFLKSEEKHLNVLRSEWQSPARPAALRTALSPRFRNNNTSNSNNTYSSNPSNETNSDAANEFYHKPQQRHRNEEMNFDVIELFKPPQGRLIYSRLYKKELAQLDIRQRRKILKGKDLVFRNDDVEIGLMIHRDLKDLKIIYYITPSRFLKTFLFKLESSTKLAVHAIPNELSNLEARKQYRIYLFAEVLQFPYKMPTIQIKYHPELLDIQEKLFISNEVNYFTSIIPFFFTKFLIMRPATPEMIQQAWPNGVLRGEQTPYSKKLLPKHFYILQYFPDMVNIESKQYETSYGVECEYGNTRFLLKVVIKINKFMYIQGVLTAFRDKANSERILEYTICCINELLSKTHKQIVL